MPGESEEDLRPRFYTAAVVDELQDEIASYRSSLDQLRTELARVRLERDRLASWVFDRAGVFNDDDAIGLVLRAMAGHGPYDAIAAALAEHDRRSEGDGA